MSYLSFGIFQPAEYENYQQEIKPKSGEKSEESKPGEILRMASLRVHQAMMQSNYSNNSNNGNSSNNNNNNTTKQWPHGSHDEVTMVFLYLWDFNTQNIAFSAQYLPRITNQFWKSLFILI